MAEHAFFPTSPLPHFPTAPLSHRPTDLWAAETGQREPESLEGISEDCTEWRLGGIRTLATCPAQKPRQLLRRDVLAEDTSRPSKTRYRGKTPRL